MIHTCQTVLVNAPWRVYNSYAYQAQCSCGYASNVFANVVDANGYTWDHLNRVRSGQIR